MKASLVVIVLLGLLSLCGCPLASVPVGLVPPAQAKERPAQCRGA